MTPPFMTLPMSFSNQARIMSNILGSAVVPTAAVGVSPTAFPVQNGRTFWASLP